MDIVPFADKPLGFPVDSRASFLLDVPVEPPSPGYRLLTGKLVGF